MPPLPTLEVAREAAREARAAFEEPANKLKMEQIQLQCRQGDISKFFQLCIPTASEILNGVLSKYGFQLTQNGCVDFTQELSKFVADPEICELEKELKQRFMPTIYPNPA